MTESPTAALPSTVTGLVAVNGRITTPEAAAVPAFDRGFLYGDGIFETLVAFGPRILDLGKHLQRLRASAAAVAMELPWSDAELGFELTTLSEQVAAPKKSLRLAVTRGTGMGLTLGAGLKPNRYVYCLPVNPEAPRVYHEGLALKRSTLGVTARGAAAKTSQYLPAVMATAKAVQEGYDEILWTNTDGEITEAATANVFFLARDGDTYQLVTPPAASGLLLGITRQTLLDLFQRAGIPAVEQIVYADEVARFDEAFLCSTVRGLVPVQRIDRHRLHSARSGSVFRQVERLYLAWVESQLGERRDWATGLPRPRADSEG